MAMKYAPNLAGSVRSLPAICAASADNPSMGFRFRRSIKLLPGLRLNVGKRGISTSIGVRGAHVTFGETGTRTTVGLPGSGVSYTHLDKPHHERTALPAAQLDPGTPNAWRGLLWVVLMSTVAAVVLTHWTHS
jgi:hypothetical protein